MRGLSLAICLLLLAACAAPPDRDPRLERLLAYRELVQSELAAGDWMAEPWRQLSADEDFAPVIQRMKESIGPESRVICPRRVAGEFPAYPSARRVDGREAVLLVAILIDGDGRLRKVRHAPHPRIAAEKPYVNAALDAIGKWTFSGGSVDGEPAAFVMLQPVAYALEPQAYWLWDIDSGTARCRATDLAARP